MKKLKLLTFETEIDKEKKVIREGLEKVNSLIEQSNKLLLSKGRKKLTNSELPGLLKNPRILLTKKLTEGVQISGMKLTESKILELLDINLSPITIEFQKLQGIHQYIKPAGGQFEIGENAIEEIENIHTSYAETPEEIEIVQDLQSIIDAFDNLQSKVSIQLNYAGLLTATKGAINTYFGKRCFHPKSVNLLASHIVKEKTEKA